MRTHEEVKVLRDVEATVVPAGNVMVIHEGDIVTITQALGGTFTVTTQYGYMARIAGKDADALGKEPEASQAAPQPAGPVSKDPKEIEKLIWENLKTVYDPEIPVNIYELGLVYELEVNEAGHAKIVMTLTSPNCPVAESLPAEVEQKVKAVEGVFAVNLELTWDPPWGMEKMSEAAKLTLGMV